MNKIIKFRKENKLTQKELAKKLCVSQGLLAHVESGRRQLGFELALKLEEFSGGAITRHDLRPDIYPEHITPKPAA
ncbi:MAG: helix-turn-helix domain-containing protein [Pseudomonadales bacterium]|nr:helix-turn-helix domain-containing protein [Pseudomonadales bacterium]